MLPHADDFQGWSSTIYTNAVILIHIRTDASLVWTPLTKVILPSVTGLYTLLLVLAE